MARTLGITIAGDYNSTAIKEATAGVETFGRTVNEAATKNIERLAAQRLKLKELAGEYQALAASAERGSVQQVAALDLAAKAQARLSTETVATNAAMTAAARKTAVAEGELAKFTRGAAKASGSFGKLGLGLALGSGGFIAGALATGGLKSAYDAAKELRDAEEQLAIAAHNVGAAFNHRQLEAYLQAESKVSLFTKAELTASLVGLVRATGSVTKAQEDATLAANIARATHHDLASVTQGLINLEGGRTRSLVQLGVKIPVIKTATDALTASGLKFTGQQRAEAAALDRAATATEGKRILLERYHGASEAYAKSDAASTDKLRVAENLLATSIGTVLLPVVKTIADPFAKWAQKEADSGDAAKRTKEIVGDLTTVLRDAKTVIQGVDDVTGGFKHTLEIIIGLKVASMVSGWIGPLSRLTTAWRGVEAAAGGAAAAEGAAAGAGGAGALGKLGRFGGLVAGSFALGEAGTLNKAKIVNGRYVANGMDLGPAPGVSGGPFGGLPAGGKLVTRPVFGGASKAAIIASAKAHGVDPTAALAVAAAEGGFSGAIGDGGHAFGPFQLNNAGGVATGMGGGFLQGFANSRAGIDFAMKKIAGVAGGLSGYDAIRAIITRFERPADGGAGDLKRATAFLMGGSTTSMAGAQNGDTLAAILAGGKHKSPGIVRGAALISSGLLDKITGDKNNAADSSGGIANMWLHRELADIEKARKEVAAKLKGASPKQKTAIDAELRVIDTQIAGVNKSITTNLKEQANAIKANAKAAIGAAKANIASAFGQIITDARSAFEKETQDYIDNVLSAKYLQGTDTHGMRLQTASEKKLADMQAADTASQLQDALTAAKKQLADDTTGALLQHVVDITTGATKDIFGPAGTSAQKSLDQKAIDAAQRALDENTIAIDAAKERAQEDYDYAQAVRTYQQERALAESAMVKSLNELEKNVETGKASFTDLQGVLAGFGVAISDIPADQWSTDFADLGSAVQALAKVMADEAAALARIGDGKDAAVAQAVADSISWGTPVAPGQSSVTSGLGGAGGYFLLNRIAHAAVGANVLSDGLIYAHRGEKVQPASVAGYSGGGGGHTFIIQAPNYVGDHADLVAAIKSPALVEAVATAVLVGNRRGHIRANQLT